MNDVTVIGNVKLNPYTPSVKIYLWDIDNNEVSLSLNIDTARQLKEKLNEFFKDSKSSS